LRLLIDTHIVLAIVDRQLDQRYPVLARRFDSEGALLFVSIASLWEIAIKTRLKKLNPRVPPPLMPGYFADLEIPVLAISARHATANLEHNVPTRDPFDRLLLAQAQLEGMRFVTVDRALADHPVTFR
jgi:PIN domain nuclease of toxin-antitoxin system